MKTIFVAGLFSERNRILLDQLCQRYRVITTRFSDGWAEGAFPVEYLEDLVPPLDEELHKLEFIQEFGELLSYSDSLLPDLGLRHVSNWDPESYSQMLSLSFQLSRGVKLFRALLRYVNIDLVLVNADYSAHRRPYVIEAQEQNIPTLCIEHGFNGSVPDPSSHRLDSLVPLNCRYISDYVNVDNVIELEVVNAHLRELPERDHIKVVALGTPNDRSFNHSLGREEAAESLGVSSKRFTVTLLGSWLDAMIPSMVYRPQVDLVVFYETAIGILAELQREHDFQVIIKHHPTLAASEANQVSTQFLQDLAWRNGLDISLITYQGLEEVLAASDLFISHAYTSVLWEGLLAAKPGIIYPLESHTDTYYWPESLNQGNILFREGGLQNVFSPNELRASLVRLMDPATYGEVSARIEAFIVTNGITRDTPEQKCGRLCDFMDEIMHEWQPRIPEATLSLNLTRPLSNELIHRYQAQRIPKVLVLLPSLQPCPLIRLVFPLEEAARQGRLETRFAHLFTGELTTERLKQDVEWADIVVFQRFGSSQHLAILEYCKLLGKRVVFETDDDLLNLPPTNPEYSLFQRPEVRQPIERLVAEADLVTVSTNHLKEELTSRNSVVSVLPNVLYDPLFPEIRDVEVRHQGERVVIGYAGTSTHHADMAPIIPALERLLDEFSDTLSLVFIGCLPTQFVGHPGVTLIPETQDYQAFVETLRHSGIHIGLAPLVDNAFNNSKSPIKWMEYAACGIVSVCSDVGPYHEAIVDGETGVLVEGLSSEAWYQALKLLIVDTAYRMRIARQAYQAIREEHMLSRSVHRWVKAYQSLLSKGGLLSDRREINLVTLASDPQFIQTLRVYLELFSEEDDVALHVLVLAGLEKAQEATLKVIAEAGMDPERIPDVLILGISDASPEFTQYLREADFVVGSSELVATARHLGLQAVDPGDLETLLFPSRHTVLGERPIVSIVIPVYNKLEYTQKCIETLIENTTPDLPYEVIIVDNASTDGTKDFLRHLEGDVQILVNERNLGFAKACNQGAAKARGRYVLFLNNDTEPQPGWLEPLIDVLEEDEQIGAVGARLLYPDGTLQHAGVTVVEDRQNGLPLNCLHRFHRLPADYSQANLREDVQVVTGAALMIRRELFFEIGGFDEAYWNGNEDVDLCFKLAQKGWRIVYQPESCLIHHESVSGEERWSKLNENIQLLLQRWTGKVVPDVLINSDGQQLPHPARSGVKQLEDKVSIVLLGFNLLAFTKLCVESVLTNSDVPFELILVDNGSVDGTREYFQDLAARDARVKAVLNSRNLGFARGCNQGIALATGGYVLFLNNDTIVPRGWLSRLLAHFKARPAVGAVGTISNRVSGPQELPSVPMANHPDALPEILAFGDEIAARASGQGFELARLVGYCLMVRRDVLDRIGGFDPCFGIGNFEDDDLCLRIRTAGFRTWVAQDVYVHHFGSRTFASLGTSVIVDTLEQGWEAFKRKWDLPTHLERNRGYRVDLPAFDSNRHFVPLDRDLEDEYADPFRLGTPPLHLQDRRAVAFFHHPDWASNAWQEVVTAYARAFVAEEDVSLVLWLDPTQGVGLDDASLRLVEVLIQAGLDPESVPDLLLVPDFLDLEGLASLYAATDCVVVAGDARQATRAEQIGRRILCDLTVDAWREAQQSLATEVRA